jgi:arsenate reductase
MDKKTRILFLCTGNSCRSQMAEGWTRHLRSGEYEPYSAGVAQKTIDPLAVRVMAEAGVDISAQRSKGLGDLAGVEFDIVVTVCDNAREMCPLYPGTTRVVHRSFDDPPTLAASAPGEEAALDIYRRVRDEIREFVAGLPESLDTTAS